MPSLDQMTDQEKEALAELISKKPVKERRKKKITDPVHSAAYYEKRLLETVFKKSTY